MKRDLQVTQTRERILKAAAACFAEKGYSGCSVQDIADRAEVSKGALYGHFKSKAELFKAMIAIEHGLGAERAQKAAEKTPTWTASSVHDGVHPQFRLSYGPPAVGWKFWLWPARDPDHEKCLCGRVNWATRRFFNDIAGKSCRCGRD